MFEITVVALSPWSHHAVLPEELCVAAVSSKEAAYLHLAVRQSCLVCKVS